MTQPTPEKSDINAYLSQHTRKSPHPQRLGKLAFPFSMLLILLFALFLLPLFLYMLVFNKLYFWQRNQNSVPMKPYFNYNRHRVPHLSLIDKIWCEYCEWANSTLQWTTDIVNEIERRYCPIKSQCDPHCAKAKAWRDDFLPHDHSLDDLKAYYRDGGYVSLSVCEKEHPEKD